MDKRSSHFYEFGPFRVDAVERLLTGDGVLLPLTPKAFETLLALVENSGRVVGRDELIVRVWPDTCVEEANLTQNVFTLRKVLGEKKRECRYIETVPRRGYRFVASVREVKDEVIVSLRGMEFETKVVAGEGSQTGTKGKALAVLPFRIISPRNNDEYLGFGLADALITKLSNLRQLTVRPTSAVAKYIGGVQDLISTGRELRVDLALEGSIQKYGKKLRVTVQLVSIPEGSALWAEKFDVRFTDILSVEDSISERVTATLPLELASEEKLYLTRQYTRKDKAYKHYLKGRFFWNKSRFFRKKQRTAQALRRSAEYFEQAINIDSNYALAYAGLSDSYILLSTSNVFLPNQCLLSAKKAALKALAIDGALAEAHCSLATVHTLYDWDWPAAEREYRRALELNPNYVTAHHWYAKYLAKMGRYVEAISEIKRAHELDPLSLLIITEIGRLSFFARKYDQAIEHCLEALDMDRNLNPAHAVLGLACVEKGLYDEALRHARKLLCALRDDIEPMAFVGYIYGRAGRILEVRKILGEWESVSASTLISPFYRAVIYAGLGENNQALAWLEKACEDRSYLLTYLNIPIFDSLRSSPKFIYLLKKVGF
jgi:DNA-binding winged helix-turn-helix (wHTH) protein/tetratricopeptide (TPR) repeat protein